MLAAETGQQFSLSSIPRDTIRSTIVEGVRHLGIVDGFYYGEEPRNFKTPYLLTTPEEKADFAMAYEDMLAKNGEDMVNNWESYVAYSKRAAFAREYWTNHSSEFRKQSEKMKIVWMHEALMDGGEVWFKAVEKLANGKLDSPIVLTHDVEQKLVFQYAEDERSEGSLSTQLR